LERPLWAPWRIEHILDPKKHADGCVLCALGGGPTGEEGLVLHLGARAYIVLNRYPYASGHLMIVPRAHGADFAALDAETASEMQALLQRSVAALTAVMRPHGFNLGMNLGEPAGAGIPGHLHWHVVPRWNGDNSFMPVLADVRVLPEHLLSTWRRLRPAFAPPREGETTP
jgi:ATP adenylyltransferase